MHASIILRLFYTATLKDILTVIKCNDFAAARFAHGVEIKLTVIRKYTANETFRAERDRNNASRGQMLFKHLIKIRINIGETQTYYFEPGIHYYKRFFYCSKALVPTTK